MNLRNSLEKLEYNNILEMLSLNCHTYIGKNLALNLGPCFNKEKVQKLLDETSEAKNLIIRKGNSPITDFGDVSSSIKKLESNISLSSKELLEIANIFKLSRELKSYFYSDENFDLSSFPILDTSFSNLYSNLDVEKSIFSAILDENTIADDASSKLNNIRKNKHKLEDDIKNSLNNILHSSNYSKAIMEPIVTIRNDRYVIPVKEEFRSLIKGFIHDISSSGSTVFIEPMTVFELNNKLQSLKVEENAEIEHILNVLSQKIVPYTKELQNNISLIGRLDLIFAKASLAIQMDAICPTLNNSKLLDLRKARHPLIDKAHVVPIDIKIGETFSSLVITGPNTGGKTVALKTCGLLCVLAFTGLFIPAAEGSSIYVFDNIFADIGDEQSIQESLSTFSSHMTNIINIVENATKNSLILIDELGSGTDPVEGSSLAISILEYFYKLGAMCLTTTHYPEIKNYALVTDGFENASTRFDIENLKPTYQLLIGVPGKSNAFAISKKLGLKEEILLRARNLLNEEDINIEELLKNIYDDKLIIEKEKEEIEKNRHQIEALRKSLEEDKYAQVELKKQNNEKVQIEARNILLSAKAEASDIIRELNILYDNLKQLENINLENASDSEIANFVKLHFQKGTLKNANELRNRLNTSLEKLYKSNINNGISENNNTQQLKKEDLKVGMNVKLANFKDTATIISLSGFLLFFTESIREKKTTLSETLIALAGGLAGNAVNTNVLAAAYHFNSRGDLSFTAYLPEKAGELLMGIVHGYGYTEGPAVFFAVLANICALLLLVCIVHYYVNVFAKNENRTAEERILAELVLLMVVVYFLLYLFTDLFYEECCVLLFTVFAAPLICFSLTHYEPEENGGFPVWKGMIPLLGLLAVFVAGIATYSNLAGTDKTSTLKEISEELVSQGYDSGYASYWNGNIMTELSDGRFEMFNWDDYVTEKIDVEELYLLNQPISHEEKKPEGKVFILLSTQEEGECPLVRYLTEENEAARNEDYVAYGFTDYENMLSCLSGFEYDLSEGNWLAGNGKTEQGNWVLPIGSVSNGPNITFYTGDYEILIEGSGIDRLTYDVTSEFGETVLKDTMVENDPEHMKLAVSVPENTYHVELRLKNITPEDIVITKITIRRVGGKDAL